MILIGQFDSPFVRRVGIALELYGLNYEHRPWSVWRDADAIAPYNPLRRVPTLILNDGESLVDSAAILDFLDEQVGEARAMVPRHGKARREVLQITALATGLADKAVSLVYERLLHANVSDTWLARCRTQIDAVIEVLESDRARRRTAYWFGDALTHADIAVACVLRFIREAHQGAFDLEAHPALAAHASMCEGLPVFARISQPFSV